MWKAGLAGWHKGHKDNTSSLNVKIYIYTYINHEQNERSNYFPSENFSVSNRTIYSDSLTTTHSHSLLSEAIRFVIHCPPVQGSWVYSKTHTDIKVVSLMLKEKSCCLFCRVKKQPLAIFHLQSTLWKSNMWCSEGTQWMPHESLAHLTHVSQFSKAWPWEVPFHPSDSLLWATTAPSTWR